MLERLDNFLNRITMYRLMLYYLLVLWLLALGLSFVGVMPFTPQALILSGAVILAMAWAANYIFAEVFNVPANVESIYITALILALIITPVSSFTDSAGLAFLGWAALWAMASKFILAIRKKHVFNPAAFAVALTALTINQSASWWVGGNMWLLPAVLLGGVMVVRKIQRADLVLSFLLAALLSIGLGVGLNGGDWLNSWNRALWSSPLLFFAFVMITEPLTTPPTRPRRIAYGLLTGLLFAPAAHLGPVYSTPELALLVGNIFSYLVSPKQRLILRLKEKVRIAEDMYDFVFVPDEKLSFRPGQYMEWTLGHAKPDNRGNRRYFTIASSPTEREIIVGVKFYPDSSSFKKKMLALRPGDTVVASELAGDFVLPRGKNKKLAFIAGGIGITPFRSMLRYMADRGLHRDAVLLYANRAADEIAYRDVFREAAEKNAAKVVYTLTGRDLPAGWSGEKGRVDAEMIKRQIPDYRERIFYISGPRTMVRSAENILQQIGVRKRRIKTDFFPGFA